MTCTPITDPSSTRISAEIMSARRLTDEGVLTATDCSEIAAGRCGRKPCVREHIFGDQRPFAQCHASTLVQLPNDTILSAWFGGTEEGHDDVGIWGCRRSRQQWSEPRLIAKVRQEAHWNPVLFCASDGRLHLFFKVGKNTELWQTWTMVSDDKGTVWSQPRELVPGDYGGRGPVKNKPIILSDGAWLAPASVERRELYDVFVDRSIDNGQTWEATDLIPLDRSKVTGTGVVQPTLWESGPGYVHMLIRSSSGKICRSDSKDFGRTWSAIYQTGLPNNNSGIDLAKLHNGTLALAYNPVSGDWGERTPLSVALSYDNGKTWPHRLDIETGDGEFSYPAIVPTAKGIAMTYTWNRERIGFWLGSASRIECQGQPPTER